jgi:hypothetical protein
MPPYQTSLMYKWTRTASQCTMQQENAGGMEVFPLAASGAPRFASL